jgi:predicted transcriptional regulator
MSATSMTNILEVLDWDRLPAGVETKRIASMLLAGYSQAETAAELGLLESSVSQRVAELRRAMVEQLAESDDELSRRLRARAEELQEARRAGGQRVSPESSSTPRSRGIGDCNDRAHLSRREFAPPP